MPYTNLIQVCMSKSAWDPVPLSELPIPLSVAPPRPCSRHSKQRDLEQWKDTLEHGAAALLLPPPELSAGPPFLPAPSPAHPPTHKCILRSPVSWASDLPSHLHPGPAAPFLSVPLFLRPPSTLPHTPHPKPTHTHTPGGRFRLEEYAVLPNPLPLPSAVTLLDILDCMSFVRSHMRGARSTEQQAGHASAGCQELTLLLAGLLLCSSPRYPVAPSQGAFKCIPPVHMPVCPPGPVLYHVLMVAAAPALSFLCPSPLGACRRRAQGVQQ
jgi:hypothetical protein